ncbi:oxidoreductase [Streptomyces sp. NPDC005435]|uniref:oxidoreductase n=1 Tax=Streptomyces sp. NPDC005435 TaxID=3154464 RepID=UPI0034550452
MLSYDELTSAERELWDAFPEGCRVDLRTGADESGAGDALADDSVEGAHWQPERTVRAAVVAMLLLGANGDQAGTVAALRLTGARITGRLDLSGAEVCHTVSLRYCRLDEAVSLRGATTRTVELTDSWTPGIDAELARVEGDLDLRRSTVEGGMLTVVGAHVAGNLLLTEARIASAGEWAVLAGGLSVEGGLFGRRLTTRGGLRLPGAQLRNGLYLPAARLENAGGVALAAGAVTASAVDCSEGFTAEGEVRFRRTRTEGPLTLAGARLNGTGIALDCVAMQVGELDYTPAAPPEGTVDLRSARAAWCRDRDECWPEKVLLDGFTYDALRFEDSADAGDEGATSARDAVATPASDDVARRLAWLRRNPGYAPQPYEQLAAWYRRIGHDDHARRVLLAKQRHRRRTLPLPQRAWGHLLDLTVGYGYRPWLAGVWLLVLTLLGTESFATRSPTPSNPGEGAPFHPLVYTLDLLIPIGGLGQRTAWYWPDGALQWLAYLLIAMGWVLTTAVVAGVTRTLQKS